MAENRITCTKCGTQLSGATVQQIIEWDKTHVCPPPDDEPHHPACEKYGDDSGCARCNR